MSFAAETNLLRELLAGGMRRIRSMRDAGGLSSGSVLFIPCTGPEMTAAVSSILASAFRSKNELVWEVMGAGRHPTTPGLKAFARTIDEMHGSGSFSVLKSETEPALLDDDLLGCTSCDFDLRMEKLYPRLSPAALETHNIALLDGIVALLLAAPSEHPARHLLVADPNLKDTEVFNALRLLAEKCKLTANISTSSFHTWIVCDTGEEADAAHFRFLLELACIENPLALRIEWPVPSPQDLRSLLFARLSDSTLSGELSLDIVMHLKDDLGMSFDESLPFAPSVWLQALADKAPQVITGFDESVAGIVSEEILDWDLLPPSEVLSTLLAYCSFERIQTYLQERQALVLQSPACQYLFACTQWPRYCERLTPWLSEWEAMSAPRSRFVCAVLARIAWYHGRDDLVRAFLDRDCGPWCSMPSYVSLQIVLSWICTLWRASYEETVELAPRFREIILGFRGALDDGLVDDVAAVLDLSLVACRPAALADSVLAARVAGEIEALNDHLDELARRLPFIFTEISSDLQAMPRLSSVSPGTVYFAETDVRLRFRFNRAATMPVVINNLAAKLNDLGDYESALRSAMIALVMTKFTGNPRDRTINLLDFSLGKIGGGFVSDAARESLLEGIALLGTLHDELLDVKYTSLAIEGLSAFASLPELQAHVNLARERLGAKISEVPDLMLRLDAWEFFNRCEEFWEERGSSSGFREICRGVVVTEAALVARIDSNLRGDSSHNDESVHLCIVLEFMLAALRNDYALLWGAISRLQRLEDEEELRLAPMRAALLAACLDVLPESCGDVHSAALGLVQGALLRAFFFGWRSDAVRLQLLESPHFQRGLTAIRCADFGARRDLWRLALHGLAEIESTEGLAAALFLSLAMEMEPVEVEVELGVDQKSGFRMHCERNAQFQTSPWRTRGLAWHLTTSTGLEGPSRAKTRTSQLAVDWHCRRYGDVIEFHSARRSILIRVVHAAGSQVERIWAWCNTDPTFADFLVYAGCCYERIQATEKSRRIERQTQQNAQAMAANAIELSDLLQNEREKLKEANTSLVAVNDKLLEMDRIKTLFYAREMEAAQAVQTHLLPYSLPPPYLTVESHYQAAEQTGGDWYTYSIDEANHTLYVFVGDVTGHGVPAALVTGLVHGVVLAELEKYCANSSGPLGKRLLSTALTLNASLSKSVSRAGKVMTMNLVGIDLASGHGEFVNAGHCHPIILDRKGNSRKLLATGSILGFNSDPKFDVVPFEIDLDAGEMVVLYTDGLVENEGPGGARISAHRLLKLIRSQRSAAELKQSIIDLCALTWREEKPADDTTFLIISFENFGSGNQVIRGGTNLGSLTHSLNG